METERERFLNHISNKSPATIKTYTQQYNKIVEKELGKKAIGKTDFDEIKELLLSQKTVNTMQQRLNIFLLVAKMNEDVELETKLKDIRTKNTEKINQENKEKNVKLAENLPKYSELVEYTENLFNKKNWVGYLINRLILDYNVRNEDIDLTITKDKNEINREDNFIFVSPRAITYIRNKYKTAKTYGQKKHDIKDTKLRKAIRSILEMNETDTYSLLKGKDIGYFVLKYTKDKLGEGNYFKIAIHENLGNLQKLGEMSENRGTDLKTIKDFYDLEKM